MIDTWKKIWISPDKQNVGTFVEVTLDSIANKAVLIGYHHSPSKMVIFEDEIDDLIDALNQMKTYL